METRQTELVEREAKDKNISEKNARKSMECCSAQPLVISAVNKNGRVIIKNKVTRGRKVLSSHISENSAPLKQMCENYP